MGLLCHFLGLSFPTSTQMVTLFRTSVRPKLGAHLGIGHFPPVIAQEMSLTLFCFRGIVTGW